MERLASIHRSDIRGGWLSAGSVIETAGPVIAGVKARRSSRHDVICVGDALLVGVRQAPEPGISP